MRSVRCAGLLDVNPFGHRCLDSRQRRAGRLRNSCRCRGVCHHPSLSLLPYRSHDARGVVCKRLLDVGGKLPWPKPKQFAWHTQGAGKLLDVFFGRDSLAAFVQAQQSLDVYKRQSQSRVYRLLASEPAVSSDHRFQQRPTCGTALRSTAS